LQKDVNGRARRVRFLPDWLLVTNVISALMRYDPWVVARLASVPERERILVSVVTNAEIRYGIRRMPAGRRRRSLERAYELLLLQLERWLDVTREVSEVYARIKAGLESRGVILPENDLWIAATALVHELTLVTNDGHFAAVPGLSRDDWSVPKQ
jgi:tRNA(fMet)-specific endonuclease VapC